MTTLAPKSILKKSGAAPAAVKKSLSFNDNVAVIGESTNIALLPPAPMKEPDAKSGSYRMGTMRIKGPAVLNGAKPAINDLYGGGGATSTELKEQQQKSVPYGATKQAKIAEPDPIVREGTILEGGLKVLKETGVKGTWVKRHVVLTRTELSYYKDAFTVQPIKTYSISSDCYVKEISKRQGVLDCSNSLEVFFPKNGVVLKGASQREATEWITAICSVIDSLGGNSGSDDDMIFIEEGVDDFDEFVETPEPPKSLYSFSAAPTPVAVTVSAPVTPVVSITPAPAPVVPVAAAPVTPVAVTPAAPAPVTPVVSVTPAPSPVVPVAAAPVTPVAVTPVAASTAKTEHVTIVKTPAAASSSKTTPAPAPSNDDDDEFEWYDEDEEPVKTTFHAVTHSPAPKHHHEPAPTPVSATKSAPSSLGTNVTSKTLHPTTPAPAPAPTPVATSTPAPAPTPAATTAPTRSGTVTATKTQPRATGFYTGVPRTNTVSTPANRTTASGPGRTASTGASQPAPAPAPAATATTPAAAKTPAATATKSTPYGRPPVTSTIAPSGVNTGKVSGLLKMWEQNK